MKYRNFDWTSKVWSFTTDVNVDHWTRIYHLDYFGGHLGWKQEISQIVSYRRYGFYHFSLETWCGFAPVERVPAYCQNRKPCLWNNLHLSYEFFLHFLSTLPARLDVVGVNEFCFATLDGFLIAHICGQLAFVNKLRPLYFFAFKQNHRLFHQNIQLLYWKINLRDQNKLGKMLSCKILDQVSIHSLTYDPVPEHLLSILGNYGNIWIAFQIFWV